MGGELFDELDEWPAASGRGQHRLIVDPRVAITQALLVLLDQQFEIVVLGLGSFLFRRLRGYALTLVPLAHPQVFAIGRV